MNIGTDTMQAMIEAECTFISKMLCEKNTKYQNSVLSSSGVFSRLDPIERINVRMEDKLSRLQNGLADDEDAEMDLAGYLILKRVVTKLLANAGREVVQKVNMADTHKVDIPVQSIPTEALEEIKQAEAKPEPKKRAPRKKKADPVVEAPAEEAPAEEAITTLDIPEETPEAIEPVKTEESDLLEVSAEELLGALGQAAEEPVETISEEGMMGLL